ncbi:MAG: response regulator [Thermoleophilaceae bacterium]|nr:response regulator [Thermoleophilaceae bacterium]
MNAADAPTPAQPVVVVADDNDDIRQLLVTRLTIRGYTVLEAADGGEALALIRSTKPDAAILDWVMPVLQGHELCVQLKTDPETENVAVMMLTARGANQDRLLGLDLGADAYIVKPFEFEDVAAQLADIIAQRARSAQ